MKAVLPYLGILLILAIFSIAISMFLNRPEPKPIEQENETSIEANEFPSVGESENREQNDDSSNPESPQADQTDEPAEKQNNQEILHGLLEKIGKQTQVNPFLFKWKTSANGIAKEVLAKGHQVIFDGTSEDAQKSKDYLREQNFHLDANNFTENANQRGEGFSRGNIVCLIFGPVPTSQSFFSEQEQQQISQISVNCGDVQ